MAAAESRHDLPTPLAGLEDERQTSLPDGSSIDETEGILFALAQAVEQRDHHTAGHCERLALISVTMGIALQFDRARLLALYRGGHLHDVGKVGIPDSVLFKPSRLSAQEWVVMRSHTTRGEEICRHLKSLAPVLPVIRHHHERWDGGGYPDGLRGEQIPQLARIVQIADIYDALTNPRPYKQAYPAAKAIEIIQREGDRGWRDPQIVELFTRLHKDVISKIEGYTAEANRTGDGMRASLANLQQFLNRNSLP
ncbi:MAG: HD domain-containing protein [Acidobacteriia bacterium]|nr:HD domain-containing protein [Terriglobia bacterium]